MTTVSAPADDQAPEQSDQPVEQPAPPSVPAVAVPAPLTLRTVMKGYSGPRDLDGQLRLSARLAKARNVVPIKYRDNPDDLLALMHQAIALDIELATAWRHLHFNPDGVGGMTAQLMHGLVIRAGHRIEPVHVDRTVVRMRMARGDGKPSGHAQWTMLEAQGARLHLRDNSPWVPYPEDMLWARCMSRLCRRWAPDVILGFYVLEDLHDIPTDDAISPVDLSTAMTDLDGHLVPAPDVVELLADLDTKTFPEIRQVWKQASEEGLLGQYAGTMDGIHHTVEEVLYDKGSEIGAREEAERQAAARLAAANESAEQTATAPGDQAEPVTAAEDAPAGTGDRLACGCNPAAVLAGGRHEEGCTRDAGN